MLVERFRLGRRVARRIAAIKSRLELQHEYGFASAAVRCGSFGRVLVYAWDECSVQAASSTRRRGCLLLHRLIVVQSAHHPGIKHERARVFTSSVSYSSSVLKHDSQEQLCSKGATPLQRHHSTTRRDCKRERCVASSRSQPSQAPRPTSRSENHGATSPYEAAAPRSNPAASSPRHQLKGAAPLLIVGGGSRLVKELEPCPSRYS